MKPNLAVALAYIQNLIGDMSASDVASFSTGFIGEAIRVQYPDRMDIADFVDSIAHGN